MPYKDPSKAKEYRAAYYKKHKKDLIARQMARDEARIEEVTAYRKEYYRQNRESLLEKQRMRNKRNYEEKKDVYAARSKMWANANPERMSFLIKKNKLENTQRYSDYRRRYYLDNMEASAVNARISKMKRFGITPDQYENMMARQGGVCAICGMENEAKNQFYLHIDHCHKTGKVRGLLCGKCNAMLGMARDSVQNLKSAIQYLSSSFGSI